MTAKINLTDEDHKKILIISNDCFSLTQNNGKTIFSLVQTLPVENIAQLYFNPSIPEIIGYRYFRVTDADIIKGQLCPRKRGREVIPRLGQKEIIKKPGQGSKIPKNDYVKIVREIIWNHSWLSPQLIRWLDEMKPEIVFFVAGDVLFSHEIANWIVKRYKARFCVYVTDDYVLPRKSDNVVQCIRRKVIARTMRQTVGKANVLFTISERMKLCYARFLKKDSSILFNITDSLCDETLVKRKKDGIIFTYVGGLYWGREDTLYVLAKAIKACNKDNRFKARLDYCSNILPSKNVQEKLDSTGVIKNCGSLNKEQLKKKLNNTDILVFVESFNVSEIEKTRLSFSTKIPEYLSLGKPILAIGPDKIGSMDYLKKVACCVTDLNNLESRIEQLIKSEEFRVELAKKAKKRYMGDCNETMLRKRFIYKLIGK